MIDSANYAPPFPHGIVAGCLPRVSRPGEWCPMASERVKVIPRSEWADAAKQIGGGLGLRPFVREILSQGSVGSCATEATAGATMIVRAFSGMPHVPLNPWFIYHHTSGGVDRGSSIDENLRFARDKGIASIAAWPRSQGWRTRPSEAAYEDAKLHRIEEFWDVSSVDEMVTCLLLGYPVVYGSNGHAVVAVEHDNDAQPISLNSWGPGWKDGGFGVWATYRAIQWGYGAFAVRVATETK